MPERACQPRLPLGGFLGSSPSRSSTCNAATHRVGRRCRQPAARTAEPALDSALSPDPHHPWPIERGPPRRQSPRLQDPADRRPGQHPRRARGGTSTELTAHRAAATPAQIWPSRPWNGTQGHRSTRTRPGCCERVADRPNHRVEATLPSGSAHIRRDHPQGAIPQLPARGIVGVGGCCGCGAKTTTGAWRCSAARDGSSGGSTVPPRATRCGSA